MWRVYVGACNAFARLCEDAVHVGGGTRVTGVHTYIRRYATYLRSNSQGAVPLSLPCHDLSSARTVHLSRSRCRLPNCAGVTFGAGRARDIPPCKGSLKPTVSR